MNARKNNILLYLACFLLITLAGCFLFFVGGVRSGHDISFHLLRIRGLADCIRNLEPLGRIQTLWCNGYGHAVGVCYNHILLYPAAFMNRLWFSLDTSYITLVLYLTFLTSLIAFYAFRRLSHSPYFGMIGSILYTLSLYRLNNVYTRAAVGETCAMIFLPLVVLGLYELYAPNGAVMCSESGLQNQSVSKRPVLHLVASATGIASSHVITVRTVALYCIVFALVFWRKTFSKDVIIKLLQAILLTLLLNLYVLVPLLDYYLNRIISISVVGTWDSIQKTTMALSKMFYPPVTAGPGGMIFSPNLNTIYLPALCVIIVFLIYSKISIRNDSLTGNRRQSSFHVMFTLLCGVLCSLLLCSRLFPYHFLQENTPLLYELITSGAEFVWRFLNLGNVLVISLAVYSLSLFGQSQEHRHSACILGALLAFLVVLQAGHYMYGYFHTSAGNASEDAKYNTFLVSTGEFLTAGADIDYMKEHPEISTSDDTMVHAEFLSRRGTRILLQVSNQSEAENYIELPVLNYKGYQALSENGQKLPVSMGISDRMRIAVPPFYDGAVRVAFHTPFYWRITDLISLFTLCCLLIKVFPKRESSSKQQ